uniref:Malonyl-CoA:ACP transacylase (MAT) domain-containing protein n=1 Tax=Eucampia antarctica TaxID=49252 RepID=A0A7S2WHJ2_9STRA|mmetsp:Transcript_29914/g.28792  ORF Transcript_29914/g.28792 Transcript_29914/m.28792 type:complete len:358 (+) Transcript_29914:41-1114(+)|eukprot:CAMPEP_0197837452 /NCGR_PEP_ID=MMETSP1437-20131217/32176_1 /TAXON_ID=49252 ORGANISM="Eucampia antarctica, Strain CCMP1452" /NCGR_SAMPLE_ID=MMETSP1437 /ASSEMBLY_ACC=CAM_ASM_001096 /LENGTH=357 /DNA_ID=CAMNT_0043444503 /DNA_START=41 /DNA_END=1114 /DNA_ORIENTATION=-
MARYSYMSLTLLSAASLVATRQCSAFSVARSPLVRSISTKLAASDDDFDDFTSKVSFMFPGQGAQFVGMCGELVKDVPAAKALFDEASEVLGYDLLERCVEGPKELLDSTEVSQPAIFVASMAAVEKMKQEKGQEAMDAATCAMGLSLGEYSALCFADAISFADCVKITKIRGQAMQAASDAVDTGMVSIIGLDKDKVGELCDAASEKSGESVQIANYLCNGNYAVSGSSKACDVVAEIAKPEFKARMTIKLAVAGAFHTDFMAPAVSALEEVLADTEIKKPRIPVISNVDAKPHSDPDTIRKLLAKQVTSPVLWENTMELMLSKDFERAVELGPGKVTAGILKRTSRTAECENIEV